MKKDEFLLDDNAPAGPEYYEGCNFDPKELEVEEKKEEKLSDEEE